MILRMRYEDGYIAYLNGAEVARKNFAGTPTWNSTSDDNRSDAQSSEFETVSLNKFRDLLKPSPQKNVLAVQALNDNASNEKFLVLPEVIVAKNELVPRYFTAPTPGAFNISGTEGMVSEVWFSHKRGFYDVPFYLTLSTEMVYPDVKIMYTTDGSRPGQTHGAEYIAGFPVAIDGTTVIRAAAVRAGWLDSKVETHSYIFPVDVSCQSLDGQAPSPNWPPPGYFNGQVMDYGMDRKVVIDDARYSGRIIVDALKAVPTISLVTDLDSLFRPSTGIYVNAGQEGRPWERPCSVELIYPPNPQGAGFPDLVRAPDADGAWRWDLTSDMRGGFQIDAGLRIRGGFSRSGDSPKHAFRLFFRSVYGDAKLRYPLFGDEGDDVFDHIDLRCSQNYSWASQGDNKNTMVRDVFSRDLQGEMGHPYTRSRYYHLYLNGQYWGLYQTQERSEASWAESYMGGDKESYDVVTSNLAADRRVAPTDGSRDALDRLYDETIAGFHNYDRYCRVQGLNIDGTRNADFEKLLDVENLIDFMIIEYYTGDSDGPGSRFGGIPNNTWGIFNRVNPDGWKWLHHDNEHTLGAGGAGGSVENLVEPFTSAGANRDYFNPHWLHEQLMSSNADYRMKFADHVHRHFHNDGLMTLEMCRNRILNRAYQIDMAIIAESARWGDAKHAYWAHTKDDHWWPEINRLLYETYDPWGRKTYLTPRVGTVLQQFKDIDWYPDVDAPVFTNMGDYVFMGNPNAFGTIYYTLDGNDPRVPVAQSAPGPLVTLVTENAAKRRLVPTVANGGSLLGNTPGEFNVTYYKANITVGNLPTAESVISNPSYQSQVIAETSSVINYNNTYCPGHFANDRPVPGGSGDLDDYVIEATAILQIPSIGSWTFGVHSDAGFSLELTGPGSFYMDYPSSRVPADSFAVFNVATPGAYNLRLVFFERGGWSGVELFAAQGSHASFSSKFHLVGDIADGGLQVGESKVWFTNYFDHSGWPSGTGAIGYEADPTSDPNYTGLFNIDVEGQMYDNGANPNANTSCYIRIPFTCGPAEYGNMTLKVRYDDGFIAYLNGGEIARRVFPGGAMPRWNSSTYPSRHDDALAVSFELIDVSDRISLLRQGNNILALHGMNMSATDSDFLISAELVAGKVGQGEVNHDARIYSSYFMLDKSTDVKARVLDSGVWSALTEKIYPAGPVKESLRITEIMYHPQETGDPEDPNEEFIEIKNIGLDPMNLNLVRFTKGIDFTFPNRVLGAADHVVVVAKRSAFEARYPGFTGVIAGEYMGRLDNAGERIRLEDAIGQTIHDFEYKDGWRSITDGEGFSLTIIDPTGAASSIPDDGLVAHWRLDDGAGATAMDSAGTNNGTLHGNPGWTGGRIGGALSLDGDGDYVSLSPVGALAGNNVTVSMWINMSELGGAWNSILTQSDSIGDGYYLYTWSGAPAFSVVSESGDALASSSENIDWNEWYQLAATNDGSNLRLYVDGVLKGSGSSAGKTGVSDNAYIGYDYASSTYHSGLIDDVRIYNRALSESEFGGTGDPLERWGEKDSWRASAYVGGSPGGDDNGIIPNPGAIVINEVLAHSHGVAADWIELYNTTDSEIDTSGWYLSDSADDLKKYRIADGTKIDAYDYIAFYEDSNFGEFSSDPGKITSFAFSENGDEVYLSSADGGVLTGYREVEDFGASQTGVSFGRYFKRSTGNYNFVSMDHVTPGWANAYPKVGPIVISEIMYNPQSGDQKQEFVELRNIGPVAVTLYDFNEAEPWKFTDGIDYTFPGYPGFMIPAGGYVLIVADAAAYVAKYGMPPAGVIMLGPYGGKLGNSGEKLELSMPGDVDELGRRYYIRVDRVDYSDGSHPADCPGGVDLWPTGPDGGGASLSRVTGELYGNDPNNWIAATPSPGF